MPFFQTETIMDAEGVEQLIMHLETTADSIEAETYELGIAILTVSLNHLHFFFSRGERDEEIRGQIAQLKMVLGSRQETVARNVQEIESSENPVRKKP